MDAVADADFSEFMHGRWAQLVRLGYGRAGDQQLAGDLAQTALAHAYAAWPRVRRTGNPDACVRRTMLKAVGWTAYGAAGQQLGSGHGRSWSCE